MTSKPIIAVTGATGAQGGSVIKFLQADGSFAIRALTRNIRSDKARVLVNQGVEVVFADFNKPESLAEAFRGVYGVFGVTNYFESGVGGENETKHGKAMVDAAKQEGVKHIVWSTLDHTTDPVVDHFNSKAAVDDYLKASGVPRTSLYTVCFFENFLTYFPISKNAQTGQLEANWPILASDGPFGAFAVGDMGAFVLQAFKNPSEWIGKDMKIVAEVITPREVVKVLEDISGKKIDLVEISNEKFEASRSLIPGTEEIWDNMKWFYGQKGFTNRDPELTKQLYPKRYDFKTWAKDHIEALIPK